MPTWPFGSSDDASTSSREWNFANPEVIASSAALTLVSLLSIRVYKRGLRRIPTAPHIQPGMLPRKQNGSMTASRTLFGKVTSVGDGDNFRFFHTPGGRLAGWGWLRKIPTGKELIGQTVCLLAPTRTLY
jgi:hypothetical protein